MATKRRLVKSLFSCRRDGVQALVDRNIGVVGTRYFSGKEVAPVGTVVPINVMKSGTHPEVKEDSEYPEWVFTVLDEIKENSLSELEKRKDTLTWENGGKRYFKLKNRQAIKEKNRNAGTV